MVSASATATKSIFDGSQVKKLAIATEYNDAINAEEEYCNKLVKFVVNGLSTYIDFTVNLNSATGVAKDHLFHIKNDEPKELLLGTNFIESLEDVSKPEKAKEKLFNLINMWCNAKIVKYFIKEKKFPETLKLDAAGENEIKAFKEALKEYNLTGKPILNNNFFDNDYTGFKKQDDGTPDRDFSTSTLKAFLDALNIKQIGSMNIEQFFTDIFELTADSGIWNSISNTKTIFGVDLTSTSESDAVKAGINAILADINQFAADAKISWIVDSSSGTKKYTIGNDKTDIDSATLVTPTAIKATIDKKNGQYVKIAKAEKLLTPENLAIITTGYDHSKIATFTQAHNDAKALASKGKGTAADPKELLTTQEALAAAVTDAKKEKEKEWKEKTDKGHIHEIIATIEQSDFDSVIINYNGEIDKLRSDNMITSDEAALKRKLITQFDSNAAAETANKKGASDKDAEWTAKVTPDKIVDFTKNFDKITKMPAFIAAHNREVGGDKQLELTTVQAQEDAV